MSITKLPNNNHAHIQNDYVFVIKHFVREVRHTNYNQMLCKWGHNQILSKWGHNEYFVGHYQTKAKHV